MKIVINKCYGGYSINDECFEAVLKRKGTIYYKSTPEDAAYFSLIGYNYYSVPENEYNVIYENDKKQGNYAKSNALCLNSNDIPRDDIDLIAVLETLGVNNFAGAYAALKIVEIPDGVDWEIEEYDGKEWVAEVHRTWS